jgi:hypothetical protein
MVEYKEAGQLVPGDVYIMRINYQRRRDQTYRVTGIRPGPASTIINVSVESMDGDRPKCRRTISFFTVNRVEMVGSRNLHFVRLAGED